VKEMGKICKILKEHNVGSIGIGAMIVFIAMVLVAGIAASVLIQTSTKLETQAMKSGQETIAEVSTGIAVDDIEGYNASGDGAISLMSICVRARAGSADIDLSQTVLEISDSSTKNYMTYGNTLVDTSSINGDLFRLSDYPSNGVQFHLIVLEDADGSCTQANPVINSGDHVVLAINTTAAFSKLQERTKVFGMVIPEEGSPGMIKFTTPAAYTKTVVELQ